jgi:hypothetical protein
MLPRHWIMLATVLIVGYALGIAFPSVGQMAVSKISPVTGS